MMVVPSIRPSQSDAYCNSTANESKNPKKLFKLVEESSWEEATTQCHKFPEQAANWIVHRDDDLGISWRRLPLHEACIRNPPESVILALLKAFPSASEAKDHNGRLALHHACVHGASKSVILLLLAANPESLQEKDIWGKTPLCVGQSTSRKDATAILEALSQQPVFYHIRNSEQKWAADEARRMSAVQMAAQSERDAFVVKINILKNQAEDKEAKYKLEKSNYDKSVMDLETALDSEKQRVQKIIVDVQEAREEAANSKARVVALENMVTANDSLQRNLQSTIEELKANLRSSELSRDDLALKCGKEAELQTQIGIVKQNLDSSKKAKLQLQDLLATKSEENQALQDTIEVKNSIEETLELQLAHRVAEHAKLQLLIKSIQEERDCYAEELRALKDEVAAKKRSEVLLVAKMEDLTKIFTSTSKASDEYQNEAATAKSEASCLVEILQATLASESALKSEVEDLQQKLSECEDKLATSTNLYATEKERYAKGVEVLKEAVEDLTSSTSSLEGLYGSSSMAMDKLEEELKCVVAEHCPFLCIPTSEQVEDNLPARIDHMYVQSSHLKKAFALLRDSSKRTEANFEDSLEQNKLLMLKNGSLQNAVEKLEKSRLKYSELTIENVNSIELTLHSYKGAVADYERMIVEAITKQKRALECCEND